MTRRILIPLALSLILSTPARSDNPSRTSSTSSDSLAGVGINNDFHGFRIPDHSWRTRSWSVEGRGSARAQHQPSSQSESGALSGSVQTAWNWAHDADRVQHSLSIYGSVGGRRDYDRSKQSYYPSPNFGQDSKSKSRSESQGESWQAHFDGRLYPSHVSPWGGRFALSGSAWYDQYWSSDRDALFSSDGTGIRERETRSTAQERAYRYYVSADAQLGRGRVRDATGVFFARILEERLRRDGRLTEALSSDTRNRLARLFYLRPTYGQVHGLSTKAFWRDVEQLLVESGSLKVERLDAYDAFHGAEPVVVTVLIDASDLEELGYYGDRFRRQIGSFIGPSISARHENYIRHLYNTQRTREWLNGDPLNSDTMKDLRREVTSDDVVFGGVRLEWHRPVGLHLQLDASTQALADFEGFATERRLESMAGLGYEINERWFAKVLAYHQRGIRSREDSGSLWSLSTSADLSYYVEDRWRITGRVTRFEAEDSFASLGHYNRNTDFRLGVSFETGRLDAPGLVPPVRPLN